MSADPSAPTSTNGSTDDTFPRQHARTQRLTLGEPRNLTIVRHDSLILFARSTGGDDPINRLWRFDVETSVETMIADPVVLLGADDDPDLPPAERARRERMREGASGITAFATDAAGTIAVFALAGRVFVTDVTTADTIEIATDGTAFDPRPSPDGNSIAFVAGRSLQVVDRSGRALTTIAEADDSSGGDSTVSWGSADFVAAEEMHRFRGYWWSPDSRSLAVCRVDERPVGIWHIADPANPELPSVEHRYPAAGTANPEVALYFCPVRNDVDTTSDQNQVRSEAPQRLRIQWDAKTLPYLASVTWDSLGLVLVVQSRDQRRIEVRGAAPTGQEPGSVSTDLLWADTDDRWVELVPGNGRRAGAHLVTCADRDGARRLLIDGEPVSPPDIQVRVILAANPVRVLMTGNPIADATVQHVYRWRIEDRDWCRLTEGDGIFTAVAGDELVVQRSATLDQPGAKWVLPDGSVVGSDAERPLVRPNVSITHSSAGGLATAVLLPHGHDGSPLPVLLDPYGGPHAQRVVRSYNAMCASQWFADQGFAVVIVDGRGTPGRGTEFERAVHHDLTSGILQDQIEGLHDAATRYPEIDLGRVAIRGWSFGGYLAALAVMRRPDVFHAAIAGAPVTEWRLYDTHYTERYLGDPNVQPEIYDANSLLPLAGRLTRPLLLIHGLADDNVVAAHTLQLSSALLAAGAPHEVLPLVGVTHMTPQEVVAENLLLHQLEFLRRSVVQTTVKQS